MSEIEQQITMYENHLSMLKDIEILDAEFRLIKNEYEQRREELVERINKSKDDLLNDKA